MYVGVTPKQGDAPGWTSGMFDTLQSGRYPRVAMMSWFNSDDYGSQLVPGTPLTAAFRSGAQSTLFAAKPQVSGNCLPATPKVKVTRKTRLSWTQLPNANSYEIWRNGKRIATTTSTTYHARAVGKYRVRGINPLGAGPFG